MSEYTVDEIMHRDPVCARAGELLVDVVELLTRHKTTGVPVIDNNHKVVGFVSEQDCIHSLLETSYFCEGNPKVDDVMNRSPLTVAPKDSVIDLARTMGRDKPKIYPVVEGGKLVGVVSRNDILNVLRKTAISCSSG